MASKSVNLEANWPQKPLRFMKEHDYLLVFLCFCLLMLTACAGSHPSEQKTLDAPLSGMRDSITQVVAGCQGDTCTYASIKFLRYSGGKGSQADSLNVFIDRQLKAMMAGFGGEESLSPAASLQDYMLAFLNDYTQIKEEYGASIPWALELEVQEVFRNDRITSLSFLAYSYMGGAHPNTFQQNLCVDLLNLKPLTLSEVVKDTLSLLPLAEAAFRHAREIPANTPFSDFGFQFPGERFHLNDNFLLSAKGLVFHFNPYEIAPYALGHTDFSIPYSQLQALMTADYLPGSRPDAQTEHHE